MLDIDSRVERDVRKVKSGRPITYFGDGGFWLKHERRLER